MRNKIPGNFTRRKAWGMFCTRGLAGWFSYGSGSSIGPTGDIFPAQVTTLTSANPGLHTTSTFTITDAAGLHAYSISSDFSYSR